MDHQAEQPLVAPGVWLTGDGEPRTDAHRKPVLFLLLEGVIGTMFETGRPETETRPTVQLATMYSIVSWYVTSTK